MSTGRYLLVLTRDEPVPALSAAALGTLTGRLAGWVSTLRRWRLLAGVGVGAVPADGPVRGCVLVTATDLCAARRLAASCPVGPVVVVPMRDGDGWDGDGWDGDG